MIVPNIQDFGPPLKRPLPCFQYDIALFCQAFQRLVPPIFPEYLSELQKMIDAFAEQAPACCPKEFPLEYRVYLMDYRMNVLFAGLDKTGEIATCFSQYGKQAHKLTDAYFGDGSLFDPLRYSAKGSYYDPVEVGDMVLKYGFLPLEELASPIALVYCGDKLDETRMLSQLQLCVLMERFREENLVDWEKIISGEKAYYSC